MEKTEWFPCTIKPVRAGYYEWSMYGGKAEAKHWFDGKEWMWVPRSRIVFNNQKLGWWRGVLK